MVTKGAIIPGEETRRIREDRRRVSSRAPTTRGERAASGAGMALPPRGERAGGRTLSFFQAEDGIRDLTVTGVQTCALPILAQVRGAAPRAQNLVLLPGA